MLNPSKPFVVISDQERWRIGDTFVVRSLGCAVSGKAGSSPFPCVPSFVLR